MPKIGYDNNMNIQLTDELRNALRQNPGEPLYLRDEESQKDYVLIEAMPPDIESERIRLAIEEGLRAVDEGRVHDWDVEETIRRGHERLARRNQS